MWVLTVNILQIFKHRVSTAKQYLGTELAKSLLPSVECCSDTEEDSDGVYYSISLLWRSELYSQFLHNLDNNTLNCLYEMSGIRQARTSIEYHRKHGIKAPKENSSPCQKLPSNCYCSTYLNSLSCTEKLIIDIKKPEDNLADITSTLDRTCWFDWYISTLLLNSQLFLLVNLTIFQQYNLYQYVMFSIQLSSHKFWTLKIFVLSNTNNSLQPKKSKYFLNVPTELKSSYLVVWKKVLDLWDLSTWNSGNKPFLLFESIWENHAFVLVFIGIILAWMRQSYWLWEENITQ